MKSKLAVAGFINSLVALAAAVVFMFNFPLFIFGGYLFLIPVAVIGIVLSSIGLVYAKMRKLEGKGMGVMGIIFGLGSIASTAIMFIFLGMVRFG